jgi:hypothetical protein
MRNYSYDKLFDFIKSKLNAQEQTDWNTPPDFIFENAIKTVNANKRRRKVAVYKKVGAFAALALILVSFLYMNSKIDNIDSKVDKLTSIQDLSINNNSEQISSSQKSDELHKKTEDINASMLSTTSQIDDGKIEKSEANQIKKVSNVIIDNIDNDLNGRATTVVDLKSDQSLTTTPSGLNSALKNPAYTQNTIKDELNATDIAPLTSIQSMRPFISIENDVLSLQNVDMAVVERKVSNFPLIISFNALSNYSFINMTNVTSTQDLSLTGYDKHCAGHGFSLALSKGLTENLYIKGTGQVQKVHNNSFLREVSPIDANNYVVDSNGESSYITDMTITTPLGEYKSSINFSMDESTLNESTNMINKTAISQSVVYTSFDLGVAYVFNPDNRLSYYIGAGAGINNAITLNNNMESEIYMDDKLMDMIDSNPTQLDDFKSVFWSYYGEAGAQLSVNDRSSFSLFLNHRASINSIKDSGLTGSSSYLKQVNLGLGYNFSF